MKRRSFLRGLAGAAAAMMVPLQLALCQPKLELVAVDPMARLSSIESTTRWMELIYSTPLMFTPDPVRMMTVMEPGVYETTYDGAKEYETHDVIYPDASHTYVE